MQYLAGAIFTFEPIKLKPQQSEFECTFIITHKILYMILWIMKTCNRKKILLSASIN